MQYCIQAEPYPFCGSWEQTALLIVDMQRDFLEQGGFGEMLGNDVSLLRSAIVPTQEILQQCRRHNLRVIHTREGHNSTLADCPTNKRARGKLEIGIGDRGPMGRVLVRGEYGHDIIPELAPLATELVIDKPGKGAFHATPLDSCLRNWSIRYLLVCGVTTEVCVNTTVREANDRGYECLVLSDCTGSYFPAFQQAGLAMIKAQGGIFGWVGRSDAVTQALAEKERLANKPTEGRHGV